MGIFIAIEGTDGAGKGTQTGLLKERLESLGRRVLVVDFPRYATPVGQEIRNWLDRKLGYALSGEVDKSELLRVATAVYRQLNP